MKEKILNFIISAAWYCMVFIVGALAFKGAFSLVNSNKPAKEFGISVFTKKGHEYVVVDTGKDVCVIHAESCPCYKK